MSEWKRIELSEVGEYITKKVIKEYYQDFSNLGVVIKVESDKTELFRFSAKDKKGKDVVVLSTLGLQCFFSSLPEENVIENIKFWQIVKNTRLFFCAAGRIVLDLCCEAEIDDVVAEYKVVESKQIELTIPADIYNKLQELESEKFNEFCSKLFINAVETELGVKQ